MANINILAVSLIVANFVGCGEAVCCGRGVHGFCKDCTRVSLFGSTKCCGARSGKGLGCNIFCCNCGGGSCRSGNPEIKYSRRGWWFVHEYSCRQMKGDVVFDHASNALEETKAVFSALDTSRDNSLSPDEFAEGLRQHLNLDFGSSHSLTGELMNNQEEENAIPLMYDAQSAYELEEEDAKDITAMLRREFLKMDANGDGRIQANEFDRDL